jgi:hypothetical protein
MTTNENLSRLGLISIGTENYDKLTDEEKCIVMEVIFKKLKNPMSSDRFMQEIKLFSDEMKEAVAEKLVEFANKILENATQPSHKKEID